MSKIIKEHKHLYRRIRGVSLNRDIVLFSDSKGEGLRELIPDFVGNNFRILSRKGATVYNKSHVSSLLRLVKELKDPIILVWLGTCEITRKVDKYIKLYEYPCQNIEFILTEYTKLRYRIRRENPTENSILYRMSLLFYHQGK